MGLVPAIIVLVATTVVVIRADYLVASVDPIVETSQNSKAFIGLILIPIVGNAAEHATAVLVAMKSNHNIASLPKVTLLKRWHRAHLRSRWTWRPPSPMRFFDAHRRTEKPISTIQVSSIVRD